jgi:hypothetical protein
METKNKERIIIDYKEIGVSTSNYSPYLSSIYNKKLYSTNVYFAKCKKFQQPKAILDKESFFDIIRNELSSATTTYNKPSDNIRLRFPIRKEYFIELLLERKKNYHYPIDEQVTELENEITMLKERINELESKISMHIKRRNTHLKNFANCRIFVM